MKFDDRPDFAQRLEKARIARGFETAKDAARAFGWVYESYIQHEQGIRGINKAAGKYAKAYRVSEAWLLTGEGRGPSNGVDHSLPAHIRKKFEVLPQEDVDDIMENLDALIDRKIQRLAEK